RLTARLPEDDALTRNRVFERVSCANHLASFAFGRHGGGSGLQRRRTRLRSACESLKKGSMASLEFRILGPLEALSGGRPTALGAPKQRALLAVLLAERGRVVSRERLIDALWGEQPPASAVQSLQVYVHGLRRALGPDRVVARDGELDLDRFDQAVERARGAIQGGRAEEAAVELQEALGLWRGPALADLPHEARAAAGGARLEEL